MMRIIYHKIFKPVIAKAVNHGYTVTPMVTKNKREMFHLKLTVQLLKIMASYAHGEQKEKTAAD